MLHSKHQPISHIISHKPSYYRRHALSKSGFGSFIADRFKGNFPLYIKILDVVFSMALLKVNYHEATEYTVEDLIKTFKKDSELGFQNDKYYYEEVHSINLNVYYYSKDLNQTPILDFYRFAFGEYQEAVWDDIDNHIWWRSLGCCSNSVYKSRSLKLQKAIWRLKMAALIFKRIDKKSKELMILMETDYGFKSYMEEVFQMKEINQCMTLPVMKKIIVGAINNLATSFFYAMVRNMEDLQIVKDFDISDVYAEGKENFAKRLYKVDIYEDLVRQNIEQIIIQKEFEYLRLLEASQQLTTANDSETEDEEKDLAQLSTDAESCISD